MSNRLATPGAPGINSLSVVWGPPSAAIGISGSPVTGSSGTIHLSWSGTGTPNKVLATPLLSGGDPTFRALDPNDIPSLDTSKLTSGILTQGRGGIGLSTTGVADGQLLIGRTSDHSWNLATLTAGAGVSITNGPSSITIANTSSATVSSVGLSLPAELTVSGSPVTGSGTLSATWATEAANLVLAGPTSGLADTPGFRALVAADIPSLDAAILTTGTLSLGRLSGITTTQLSATAGITSGQIASVDAATITSGTLPLGRLSGLTTSQLSATAGITSGQIASVDAATISTGTLPLGRLSGLTTSQLSATAGITSGQIASVAASTVTGTLAQSHGGTGLDTSAASDGQLLIGQSSDNSWGMATLSAGSGITITNAGHSITVAAPLATSSAVGVVKVGRSLASASDGTLSVLGVDADQVRSVAPSVIAPGIVARQISSVNPSSLTGSGTVPLAALTGITTSQLSATAGIAAGQIASVNPSALTGSGTVPLAALSGLTTSQLSGSAGITSGQIASVAASTITGALATAHGGTGLDTHLAADGALLIGNGSGLSLATLTAGANVTITNSAGGINIAAVGASAAVIDGGLAHAYSTYL